MEYSDSFESFWLKYGSQDNLKQKGVKRKAFESWQSVGKKWAKEEKAEYDESEFAKMVWRGYDAEIRNRKAARLANQFTPTLPHLTTWLNQWRFEAEQSTPTSEYREMVDAKKCSGCGTTEVIGRDRFEGWICGPCDLKDWYAGLTHGGIKPTLKPLVEKFPRNKGETWREWSIRYLSSTPVGAKLLARYGV